MTNGERISNSVLARIPLREYRRLKKQLEPVTLTFGQILYEPATAIRHVFFPIDCLISLLTAVDKRQTLEVGMVGNEGMAGMPFILGIGISGVRAIVQGGRQCLAHGCGTLSSRVRSQSGLAGGALPIHLCLDGANLANGCLQSVS